LYEVYEVITGKRVVIEYRSMY